MATCRRPSLVLRVSVLPVLSVTSPTNAVGRRTGFRDWTFSLILSPMLSVGVGVASFTAMTLVVRPMINQ